MRKIDRLTRLNKLIEILDLHIKARKKPAKLNGKSAFFEMNYWQIIRDPSNQYTTDDTCHTSACALGSCAMNPWFKRRGLKLVPDGANNLVPDGANNDVATHLGLHCRSQITAKVAFKDGTENYNAAETFFGITYAEAEWIFYPEEYTASNITPAMVKKRVKQLIRKYSEEN